MSTSHYRIETKKTPPLGTVPSKFQVKVSKLKLALHLLKELFHYFGKWEIILSRPCMYGVFSGPIGGFAPRSEKCVGCLRCMVEHPEMVRVTFNPKRRTWGDSYLTSSYYETLLNEAESGRVPIRGAGYRGSFGGKDWDGFWTDMSEIVRPTRDGIHGREYISTEVDIGEKPPFVKSGNHENFPLLTLPVPFLFDLPPASLQADPILNEVYLEAAKQLGTLFLTSNPSMASSTIPVVSSEDIPTIKGTPVAIELKGWDKKGWDQLKATYPAAVLIVRIDYTHDLLKLYQEGVRVFHLVANYHGLNMKGEFAFELIRRAHLQMVNAKIRDEITLIGSGGIAAAEHLPKAIIAGLDVVALDTPLLAALQARFIGECTSYETSRFELPPQFSAAWGVQRLKNMSNAWRDQLLEILGAMGLREVRRLRGEMGRMMSQKELENEAFKGIKGYE